MNLVEQETEPKTLDGTPLSKLGKGLPDGLDTLLCPVCQKAGYIENKRPVMETCPACQGSGTQPKKVPCRDCGGTGKFTQRRTGRVVDCKRCGGSGRYPHPFLTYQCYPCRGEKTVPVEGQFIIDYIRCSKCGGPGELTAPFNSAFRKLQELAL